MSHSRSDKVVADWTEVASAAIRPAHGPRQHSQRDSLPGGLLTGAAVVLVVILVVSTRRGSQTVVGSSPSASGSTPTTAVATVATASESPSPAEASGSPIASAADQTPSATDIAAAKILVDTYIAHLVAGNFQTAYEMLSPDSQAAWQSLADFTYDRKAYFDSVAGRYVIKVSPGDIGSITFWLTDRNRDLVDLAHAVLVEVDYPNIPTNSGYEVFIVSPGKNGLEIFAVR